MPNYTDTKVNDMIFNVLDSTQYNTLLNDNQLNNNQLYFITDDIGQLNFIKNNVTVATYNGRGTVNVDLTSANSAINDGSGQNIATTYLKNASINGQVITFTKGDGNTFTITTPDTKNTAGSTQNTSKLFLVGAASQDTNPQTYSSSKVYVTDGVLTAPTFSGSLSGNATSATKATNDSNNQNIASTYIASLSASGTTITYTRGDGATGTITTQDLDNDIKVNMTLDTTSKAYILGSTTAPMGTAQAVSSIADTGVYLGTTAGELVATKFTGALNGNAATATKATNDSSDQHIANTYIKDLSVSGTTITYTKGSGGTDTITTQDTKNTAGATQNTSKLFIVGATSQDANPQTYSSSKIYITDGVLTAPTFSGALSGNASTATKANQDSSDQVITATYLKDWDVSGATVTLTKGDGGTSTVNMPYVLKVGDTMSGSLTFSTVNGIQYQGSKATFPAIQFIDNASNSNGNGVSIGSGGLTIIGSGNSNNTIASQYSNGGTKSMLIGGDQSVIIYTNLQEGWNNKKIFTFDTAGGLTATAFHGLADAATSDSEGQHIANTYIETMTFSNSSSNVMVTPVTGGGGNKNGIQLPNATVEKYGVTKLTSTSSSSEEGLAATPKLVYNMIAALDSTISGTPAASQTLTAFVQTDGKISATFDDIEISTEQIIAGTLPVSRGGTGFSAATTVNGVVIGNSTTTSDALQTVATASGAFYATAANAKPQFGTLPVAQGGTGLTTTTNVNAVIIGNSTTASDTLQSIRTASGAFFATSQDAKPQFGTLPVAQGGTGVTAISDIQAGKDDSGNAIKTNYAHSLEIVDSALKLKDMNNNVLSSVAITTTAAQIIRW